MVLVASWVPAAVDEVLEPGLGLGLASSLGTSILLGRYAMGCSGAACRTLSNILDHQHSG